MQNEIIVNAEPRRDSCRPARAVGNSPNSISNATATTGRRRQRREGPRDAGCSPACRPSFVDIGLDKAGVPLRRRLLRRDRTASGGGNGKGGRGRGRGRVNAAVHRRPSTPLLSRGPGDRRPDRQGAHRHQGCAASPRTSRFAGRHLVLTPWSPRVGVSRRIDSDQASGGDCARWSSDFKTEGSRLHHPHRGRRACKRVRPRGGHQVPDHGLERDPAEQGRIRRRAPSVLYAEPDLPQRVHARLRELPTPSAS